ncbi:hypothetical protein HK098_004099 [Nowakowskiella sp. JEL0407]|nr:hypothetical protein HK098_004099 [Nowakowskiella sp. JEL0407]
MNIQLLVMIVNVLFCSAQPPKMPPPAAKTPQAAPMTISRILDVQTPNPARKSKSPPNLPTLTPQTPKTELSASPKLNAPSPIIPNINTPASFIFPATSDSMLVSSPSSQVSVIGISIGVTVAILFVFSAMGILYFRKRTRRATHQNRFFANVAHNEQIQNGPRLSKTYALKRTYSKQSKTNLNTIVRQSYADHNSAFRQNVSNIYSEENMIPFPPSAEMSSMESRYRSLPLPPLPQVQVVKSQPIAAEITGHRGAVDCSPRASSESAVTEEETDSRSIARQWLNKWISADEIENEATGSGVS